MSIGTPTSEEGYTLIEMLIAVMILGLSVVGIISGLSALVFASDVHRRQADAATVLVSAGEAIKDPVRNPYIDCAGSTTYDPAREVSLPASTPAWSSTAITILKVEYLDGGASFTSVCNDAAGVHAQLVTIQVKDPTSRATLTLDVVKRGP